ncbi:MAG: iron-sulfur cluster insertion protein ErpA [Methyloligellaceae bacterium]
MTENNITLSAQAAKRINEIMAAQTDKTMLRLSVEGGGCSGFQYQFDLVDSMTDEDVLIEKDGAKLLIDTVSIMYVQGSEVDFVDDLIGASFRVNNPNAIAACGCGVSFSV